MKRLLILLLTLLFVMSLTACGKNETPESAPESVSAPSEEETSVSEPEEEKDLWIPLVSVDDFGDVVTTNVTPIGAVFTGDFSNTATNSSELTVKVVVTGFDYSAFSFTLLEYGDHHPLFLGSDDKSLKIKVDDTTTEYNIKTTSDGYVFVDDSRWSEKFRDSYPEGTGLYEALMSGKDVRCVIKAGSSKYNFTIEAGNFSELAKELMQKAQAEMDAAAASQAAYEQSDEYKEEVYQKAVGLMNEDKYGRYSDAGELLATILDYKDAKELFPICFLKGSVDWPEELPQNFEDVSGEELLSLLPGTWSLTLGETYVFSEDGTVDKGESTVIGHKGERIIQSWSVEGDLLIMGDLGFKYSAKRPFENALILYTEESKTGTNNGSIAYKMWKTE